METKEAQEKVFMELYVPAFVKAAAENGVNINTEEDLQKALETAAVLNQAEQQKSSSVVKEAHDSLLKAAGIAVEEEAPATAELSPDLAEALSAL